MVRRRTKVKVSLRRNPAVLIKGVIMPKKLRGTKMSNKKMDSQKTERAMDIDRSAVKQNTEMGGETKGNLGGHKSGWF